MLPLDGAKIRVWDHYWSISYSVRRENPLLSTATSFQGYLSLARHVVYGNDYMKILIEVAEHCDTCHSVRSPALTN